MVSTGGNNLTDVIRYTTQLNIKGIEYEWIQTDNRIQVKTELGEETTFDASGMLEVHEEVGA